MVNDLQKKYEFYLRDFFRRKRSKKYSDYFFLKKVSENNRELFGWIRKKHGNHLEKCETNGKNIWIQFKYFLSFSRFWLKFCFVGLNSFQQQNKQITMGKKMNENHFFFTQHFLISVVVVVGKKEFGSTSVCVCVCGWRIFSRISFLEIKKIDVFFCWFDPENKKMQKRGKKPIKTNSEKKQHSRSMWKMARFSIESFSMMIYKEIKFEIFLNWRIWVFQWLGGGKNVFSIDEPNPNEPNSQAMNVKKNDNFIQIQNFFFSEFLLWFFYG